MRYRLREIGPEAYDAAVRLRPETCPMYYMGDRRTGCQLLQDAADDSFVPVSVFAKCFLPGDPAHQPGPSDGAKQEVRGTDPALDGGNYARACGGRGLLYGMAAVVNRLTNVIASAEPKGLSFELWARAVRDVSTWP